ncbi:TonB-dependent receptor-like beta-barrel domain-containing protein [Sphingomonas antarctica]|uniref:TonB-dependent receptor plug domain-containing protein n=1 Tax=Sphingomonas antarctica TaxID=2040274 RepID=UPI0039E7EAFB
MKNLLVLLLAGTAAPVFAQAATPTPTPATTPPAQSQTAAEPGRAARTSYDAAYFQQYAPSNALQMIQRLPGFSFDQGDQNVRGFSQAAGNVVIDGQRPSSKSDTLDTVLSRIPASRVVKIEIAPGDQFGAEYIGKSQVANVVLTAASGMTGQVEATAYRTFTGRYLPDGNASVVLKRGPSSFTLGANLSANGFPEEGYDRITALPSGQQLEYRKKLNDTREPAASLSAAWDYNDGTNKTAHLNGRYLIDRFKLSQYNQVTPSVGPARDDRLFQRYKFDNWEIGGDVTRPFAGGGLKLIGLVTRRERNNLDTSFVRPGGIVSGGTEQLLADHRDESLARLVWSRSNWNGWSAEIGGEAAINRLVSDVDLSVFDATGGRTPIDLPIDHAIVKEYRGEVFANVGRPIANKLRLDVGVTYEASKLTVRGDALADRTLKFLKPKATLDWQLPDLHAQLSVQRTVAQLQFEDFISVAELANDRVNGGNADLLPQRAWQSNLTLDRPFLGDGLLKLELGYTRISLLQDRIPTPDGFDAPGNIGSGRELLWRGTIDAPLGKLGIKGGRLTLYGSIVDTSVRDPYTGRKRRFSGNSTSFWTADYRQDLGKFAYGVHLESASLSTQYRQNELDSFYGMQPYSSVFAEYRPDKKTTFTAGVRNALDVTSARYRIFFTPSRANPNPDTFEQRQRNQHVIPYITIKHSFG